MPTLYYQVEAPGVNILKTVTDEVVAGLLQELNLASTFKDKTFIMSSFMANSQYANSQNVPDLTINRCDVDVNYIMDKSQVPWPVDTPYTTTAYGMRSTHKGNHKPIFLDEKAGILIEEHSVACALDMNFVLTFTTFDDACKAFDTIQSRYKGSLIQTPFDIAFSYPVTMAMYQYLFSVWEAKTDYKTKTLLDYINDMKKTQISWDIRKSQLAKSDADKALMIRCQQLGCLAQLTMDQKDPLVERVDAMPDTYSISFTVALQFGRPSMLAVHTPISVDNTVLPHTFFQTGLVNHHSNPYVTGMYQDYMVDEFLKRTKGDYEASNQILRMPAYDDWLSLDTLYRFYKYRPFLVAHFTLDGPVTVINLKQLDVITLHPVARAILKEMKNKVFQYGGLFNVGVYAGDARLGDSLLSLDDDLNLTIRSNRPDKEYHLVLSETTSLQKTSPEWDDILVRYRYFFPLTIERNLSSLIKKKFFTVAADNAMLTLISNLQYNGRLKKVLMIMVSLGEVTNEIYAYTQNPSQLADYMSYTQSERKGYTLPKPTDPGYDVVTEYYTTKASVEGRSLLVVFIEQCLTLGYTTLDTAPDQFLIPSRTAYPYYSGQGGFYGFNTPLRVIAYSVNVERHSN